MNYPLSFKKITGKSNIALNWSKNKNITDPNFTIDLMIFNLKSQNWYKTPIPTGLYLIPKEFCIEHVKLKSNNKTDTLIDAKNLFEMIKYSISQNLFLEIKIEPSKYEWNPCSGFKIKRSEDEKEIRRGLKNQLKWDWFELEDIPLSEFNKTRNTTLV
jgi:hypothetical protein